MASVQIHIEGISPLLQHAFSSAFESDDASRTMLLNNESPRGQAEAVVYRDGDGLCYFPGSALARMTREAGSNHKLKGSRRAVKFVVPSAVLVLEDHVYIRDKDGDPVSDFEVDSRPVTIPSTKGRIMRHRPRWDYWSARFSIEVDEQVLPLELTHQLIEEGGRRVGIGDFRPEKGGPFGRFGVISWEVV